MSTGHDSTTIGSQEQREGLVQRTAVVWKTALGSIVSWEAALLTSSKHPYLAPLTLILCLQTTLGKSIRFAWYRTLGTVVGVLLVGFFAKDLPVTAWSLGVFLLAICAVLKAFKLNDLVIHQVALSVLFVLYFEQHSDGYAFDRAKDTIIGALTGIVFMVLPPPKGELQKASEKLQAFVGHFASAVEALAQAVQEDSIHSNRFDRERLVQSLDTELRQIHQGIIDTKQTLFTKLANQQQRMELEGHFDLLNQAFAHFVTLIDVFYSRMTVEERRTWSDVLRRSAEEIRKFPYETKLQYTLQSGTETEWQFGPMGRISEFRPEVASAIQTGMMTFVQAHGAAPLARDDRGTTDTGGN